MKRILIILFFGFIGQSVFSQQKLSPELLWQMGRVSDGHISPDGNTILYQVRSADLKENKSSNIIYVMPSKGINSAKGINAKALNEAGDKVYSPSWRPDGKKIDFISAKSGEMQLWEMNPDGTDKKQVSSIKGGISNVKYSPDMKHILYTADVQVDDIHPSNLYHDLDKTSGRVFDALNFRHWDTWSDGTYSHIFYADYNSGALSGEPTDIMKGERFDSPLKPNGGDEQFNWSPDGKAIAYTSKKQTGTEYAMSTNSDIYLYELASGKTDDLTPGNKGYDQDPAFCPDGSKLAYHSMKTAGYESDRNRLMVYDFKTRQSTDLTERLDQATEAFVWEKDGKSIYFISPYQGANQVFAYEFSPIKGSNFKQLTHGNHDYNSLEIGMRGKQSVLIGSRVDYSNPAEIYEVDPEMDKETQLTFVNKDILKSIKFGKVEKRMVKTFDGKDMLTWVIYPPDFDKTKKYPTLLYCQGGPQGMVSQFWSVRWNFSLMAANGYIVVAPNRRGLPGFGQEWNDEIAGDYGGKCMNDYLSAIDDVSKEPYVNKDKLGCVGASFGGYSVYWLAGHHEKRFKAFIAHCGMFDVTSWYGSTEEMFFANHDQGGSYWDNPENYKKFSPHNFVKNWDAPILVIHDEKDFRVPITQGIEAFTAAQEQHIPSRFLYFPDENHWVSKPQNSVLWHRVFYDWLDKWLK
jgi:dipeptidyl aminopeptidase/acylaminoacyl peptidase